MTVRKDFLRNSLGFLDYGGSWSLVNPDYKGVCHIALAQEGHCHPGEVLFRMDSHRCNAGAFGQFATGSGNTDAGFIMGTGKLLVKVPPTVRFRLEGELPKYLLAKDLILQIIGEISVSGATYKAMEFCGSVVDNLTVCFTITLYGGQDDTIVIWWWKLGVRMEQQLRTKLLFSTSRS